MSREVIDKGLAEAEGPTAAGGDPGRARPDPGAQDAAAVDLAEPQAGDPRPPAIAAAGSAPREGRDGASPEPAGVDGGRGWRRTLPLPWTAALVVTAVVLGSLVGAWRAQQGARDTARVTRLLVWADFPTTSRNQTSPQVPTAEVTAMVRSVGGEALVHELSTPFGSGSLGSDLPVDPNGSHPMRIAFTPDCDTVAGWQNDWTGAPRIGSATVRDRPGEPLHQVTLELLGDLLLAELVGSCNLSPDGQTPAGSGASIPASPPALLFHGVSGSADGTLTFQVLAPSPAESVILNLAVASQFEGTGPGKFSLSATPPVPLTLNSGDDVQVVARLTYRCRPGKGAQTAPPMDAVVEILPQLVGFADPVHVDGWDQAETVVAVRGAMATAGCPPPGY